MANFVGARVRPAVVGPSSTASTSTRTGLAGLPPIPVFGSGYIHPSDVKALAMLGIGRGSRSDASRGTGSGGSTSRRSSGELRALDGAPVDRDRERRRGERRRLRPARGDGRPRRALRRLAPRRRRVRALRRGSRTATAHLVEGVERADSVIADGHKWLNVPYDCGFAFVKDAALQARRLHARAPRTSPTRGPEADLGVPGTGDVAPRAGLAVWATLRAYGRSGVPGDGRAAPRPRAAPGRRRRRGARPRAARRGAAEHRVLPLPPAGHATRSELDDLNRRIGEEAIARRPRVLRHRRTYDGKVAFRPATVNWRNRADDIDLIVDVVARARCGLRAEGFRSVARAVYSRDNCIWGCTGFDSGGYRLGEAGRDPGCLVKRRNQHKRQRRVRARCLIHR